MKQDKAQQNDTGQVEIVKNYTVLWSKAPNNMKVLNVNTLQVHSTWKTFAEARQVAYDLNMVLHRDSKRKR